MGPFFPRGSAEDLRKPFVGAVPTSDGAAEAADAVTSAEYGAGFSCAPPSESARGGIYCPCMDGGDCYLDDYFDGPDEFDLWQQSALSLRLQGEAERAAALAESETERSARKQQRREFSERRSARRARGKL